MDFRSVAIVLSSVLGLMAVACGNACDDAVDHLQECGVNAGSAEHDADCTGQAECLAECINEASCEDMKNQVPSYRNCVSGC